MKTPCRPAIRRAYFAAAFSTLLATLVPNVAWAGPRDDMKSAYGRAISQFNDMDLEGAQLTLDLAINQAKSGGLGSDPALAPLLSLYAGVLFTNSGDRARALSVFEDAVRADYHVVLPIELRSEDL